VNDLKKCPKCQMIVYAEDECPFCQETLVYEPKSESKRERLILNKYLLLYIAKSAWFSIACCIFGLVRILTAAPQISSLLISAVVCAVISLTVAIFQRSFQRIMTWKYSEDYIPFKIGILKYLLGGISVVLFLFL
ncbi:MAG: hypothetical protein J6R60_05325, partial [Clostridia bacterium]|nr:hypothetical protein [Clostridia bacterium]